MLSFHIINISIIIVATIFILHIKADCIIEYSRDAPIFSKALGTKTLILRNVQNALTLRSGETIRADCSRQLNMKYGNGYELFNSNEFVSSINLQCGSTRGSDFFSYQKLDPPSYTFNDVGYSSISLQCIQGKWQLYESNMSLPNCQTYNSYAIGIQSPWLGSFIAAHICFDLDGLKTKYIKYIANRGEHEFLREKPMLQSTLSIPIDRFDILFEPALSLGTPIKNFKQSNPMIYIHDFDYLSLVQDLSISSELEIFDYMFQVIWWRSLRLGSWKYFLDALKTNSETRMYYIYSGSSGIMSIPSTNSCDQFEKFVVEYEGQKVTAPEVIWAYLKPVKENKTEEFVIIAHNTPFYSSENSTSFCKDICHEIDWVKGSTFEKVHLLPAFGVVECCRPIDVGLKLEGFPVEVISENEETTDRITTVE